MSSAINCAVRHHEVQVNGDKSLCMFDLNNLVAPGGKFLITQEAAGLHFLLTLWAREIYCTIRCSVFIYLTVMLFIFNSI